MIRDAGPGSGGDLFRAVARLTRLRLAGLVIRARFFFLPPPSLPASREIIRHRRFPRRQVESIYWKFPQSGHYRLFWSDAGTFDLDARKARVRCYVRKNSSPPAVEEVLRGPVCSFTLLEHGFEPLHAAAVRFRSGVAAFVGPPGAGKSSLAAYLTTLGGQFHSDDVVPLKFERGRVRAYVGLGQFRLAPRSLRALGWEKRFALRTRSKATLPIRHRSLRASLPMARIYLIARGTTGSPRNIRIERLLPHKAFIALVGNSLNDALDAPWRLQRQLRIFAWLVENVPIRRLRFPSGFKQLERVCQAICRDLHA